MVRLKNLRLRVPMLQSPMAGCTDLAFRLIARAHGLELACTEMISAEAMVRQSRKTLDLLRRTAADTPLACQLVGHSAESMGEAAAALESLGFEIIDINCGCPVRKITRQGAGAALLKQPRNAEKIFRAVMNKVRKVPVTVKTRAGYQDPSGREAVRLAKLAEQAGLVLVTVHGRTQAQGYSGKADWKPIRLVKEAVKIPVLGNGDIFAPQDALRMMDETGCDGIAIGRGALGNPWLYGQIRNLWAGKDFKIPSFPEKKRTALQHIRLTAKYDGARIGLLKSRHIAPWYFKGCPGAAGLREKINRSRSLGEVLEAVRLFEPVARPKDAA